MPTGIHHLIVNFDETETATVSIVYALVLLDRWRLILRHWEISKLRHVNHTFVLRLGNKRSVWDAEIDMITFCSGSFCLKVYKIIIVFLLISCLFWKKSIFKCKHDSKERERRNLVVPMTLKPSNQSFIVLRWCRYFIRPTITFVIIEFWWCV